MSVLARGGGPAQGSRRGTHPGDPHALGSLRGPHPPPRAPPPVIQRHHRAAGSELARGAGRPSDASGDLVRASGSAPARRDRWTELRPAHGGVRAKGGRGDHRHLERAPLCLGGARNRRRGAVVGGGGEQPFPPTVTTTISPTGTSPSGEGSVERSTQPRRAVRDAWRTAYSDEVVHPFRAKPSSCSGPSRPLVPGHAVRV